MHSQQNIKIQHCCFVGGYKWSTESINLHFWGWWWRLVNTTTLSKHKITCILHPPPTKKSNKEVNEFWSSHGFDQPYSGIWHCVIWQTSTDVSGELAVSIIRVNSSVHAYHHDKIQWQWEHCCALWHFTNMVTTKTAWAMIKNTCAHTYNNLSFIYHPFATYVTLGQVNQTLR